MVFHQSIPPNNDMMLYMYAMCRGHPECKGCPFDNGKIVYDESAPNKYICLSSAYRYFNEQRARKETDGCDKNANDAT